MTFVFCLEKAGKNTGYFLYTSNSRLFAEYAGCLKSSGWSVTSGCVPNKLKVIQIKRESIVFYDSLSYVKSSPSFRTFRQRRTVTSKDIKKGERRKEKGESFREAWGIRCSVIGVRCSVLDAVIKCGRKTDYRIQFSYMTRSSSRFLNARPTTSGLRSRRIFSRSRWPMARVSAGCLRHHCSLKVISLRV